MRLGNSRIRVQKHGSFRLFSMRMPQDIELVRLKLELKDQLLW